jgi:RHH-type proline utilization regulon transcriptional repressor/proline dehydrogenase/delta 1-pyrroline-5-carboxylate dehydrogenase
VNRNVVGAVVGVQPFGGRGLSGTGPKAGGPLYLGRLVEVPPVFATRAEHLATPLQLFADWLEAQGDASGATLTRRYGEASALGAELALPGPVGERNVYTLHPRGAILMRPTTPEGLVEQMAAVLATGNRGFVEGMPLPAGLPLVVAEAFTLDRSAPVAAALVEGSRTQAAAIAEAVAAMPGAIVSVYAADPSQPLAYHCGWLLEEVSISINTTAAGGNASLMMIG